MTTLALVERSRELASEHRDPLRRTSALAFDTLNGQPHALAYTLVKEDADRPRTVYGVASVLVQFFGELGAAISVASTSTRRG